MIEAGPASGHSNMINEKKFAWWFAFCLLFVYAVLIIIIGIGKVEEHTSFGMVTVVNGLLLITEKFGNWLFNGKREKEATLEAQAEMEDKP